MGSEVGKDAFEVRSGYGPENTELLVQRWIDASETSRRQDGRVVDILRWRSPASAYPRQRLGKARIRTALYSPGMYDACGQGDVSYYCALKRLYVTTLEIEGSVWMVDDPPHWWAMEDHASCYEGHVLCAGLGLGLIVHALHANPKVEKITVIEREQDVIDLIAPQVPGKKLTVIQGDFWDQTPEAIPNVDGVFWDLFVGLGPLLVKAAVEVMAKIHYTWNQSPDFLARIHGVPNGLIVAQMLAGNICANVGTNLA